MTLAHHGIVLFQHQTQTSLIDECCGRIKVRSFLPVLIGGIYAYDLESSLKLPTMKQQELLFVPFHIVHEDFLFLYHLFEITLLFAPVGSCVKGLFTFLLWIYQKPAIWFSGKHKKFVLFKILSLLGIWPARQQIHGILAKIAEFPIDRVNEEVLDLVSEQELCAWLVQSIVCHPLAKKMKTKLFLESTLCYE